MKSYRIEISATAERQLRGLTRQDQMRILRAIQQLAEAPWPQGCRKLAGYDDVFRIRVGTYRVLYSVDRQRIVIVIFKVGHRKDVYR
jgi:mRNA interferase RelE/StbE